MPMNDPTGQVSFQVDPGLMEFLPPGQTAVQSGFFQAPEDKSKEIFDMLHAASVKAQAVAHKKAVEAETERLRTEWMLNRTADELKRIKTVTDMQRQMAPAAPPRKLNIDGTEILAMPGARGGETYRVLPPKRQMMGAPETVTEGGITYRRQVDPNTGREYSSRVGQPEGYVTPRERVGIAADARERRDLEAELKALEPELPVPGEPEAASASQRAKDAANLARATELRRLLGRGGAAIAAQLGEAPKQVRDKKGVLWNYKGTMTDPKQDKDPANWEKATE